MQKKIPTTDLEEISFEIGEIKNLCALVDAYLESSPAVPLPLYFIRTADKIQGFRHSSTYSRMSPGWQLRSLQMVSIVFHDTNSPLRSCVRVA